MERVTKSFFKEEDVLPFTEDLKGLWPKQIALNWFWLAFQALEKSGLTYYETESDENRVRERLTALVIFYYEFCHISAKHESSNFSYWNELTIRRLKNDLSDNADERLFEVRKALIQYFGSEEKVLAELWINSLEGSNNCLISLNEKLNLAQLIANDKLDNVNYCDVRTWFIGWPKGIEDFEGIAI